MGKPRRHASLSALLAGEDPTSVRPLTGEGRLGDLPNQTFSIDNPVKRLWRLVRDPHGRDVSGWQIGVVDRRGRLPTLRAELEEEFPTHILHRGLVKRRGGRERE